MLCVTGTAWKVTLNTSFCWTGLTNGTVELVLNDWLSTVAPCPGGVIVSVRFTTLPTPVVLRPAIVTPIGKAGAQLTSTPLAAMPTCSLPMNVAHPVVALHAKGALLVMRHSLVSTRAGQEEHLAVAGDVAALARRAPWNTTSTWCRWEPGSRRRTARSPRSWERSSARRSRRRADSRCCSWLASARSQVNVLRPPTR